MKLVDRVDIGNRSSDGKPLITRWRLLSTPHFGIKLHRLNHVDNPADGLHNHPWPFLSITLGSLYWDVCTLPDRSERIRKQRVRWVPAYQFHQVVRVPDGGAWTVVINGRRRTEPWGFLKDGVFTPHTSVFGANAHNEGTKRSWLSR